MFFVKRGAWSGDVKIIVLYWFLQCLVAIDILTKKQTNHKHAVRIEGVLQEGCRHPFSSILPPKPVLARNGKRVSDRDL